MKKEVRPLKLVKVLNDVGHVAIMPCEYSSLFKIVQGVFFYQGRLWTNDWAGLYASEADALAVANRLIHNITEAA